MDRGEQLARIADYAADQWGLITAAQAKRVGLSAVQLLRLAESDLIENVGRGVYVLRTAVFPSHLELKVAWLRLTPAVFASERPLGDKDSGVISHASACQLHGLGDIPAPATEISVPRRRTTTEPFVHLRTAKLEPADITLVEGLPVTTARRTILDLLRSKADGGHLGGVIADAERRDLIKVEELQDDVQPYAHAYGLPRRSTGIELIEHLVRQADGQLRYQEVARAGEKGFTMAIELMARQAASDSHAVQQIMEGLLDPETGPLYERLDETTRAVEKMAGPAVNALALYLQQLQTPRVADLAAALKRAVEQAAGPNAAFEAYLKRLQAPDSALAETTRHAIERMAEPSAAMEAYRQRLQELSKPLTAAEIAPYEQTLQRLLRAAPSVSASREAERVVGTTLQTGPQPARDHSAEAPRPLAIEQGSSARGGDEDTPSREPSQGAPEDP
ncbi:type IV toxin-antitoxin system AbiEi family antitoxin domain-containing protein [Streptomyces vinaceus]